MLVLAAQGNIFGIAKSALAALGNLLCLSMPPEEGLPRIGICSLVNSVTTGKVQLKVSPIHA